MEDIVTMTRAGGAPAGRRYHHGHLAEALLTEATDLAAQGGPDAVVLREVARRAGVSATAAYRHFENQQALQHAVKEEALRALAEHMQAAAAQLPDVEGEDRRAAAARRLIAIGDAYFEFATTRSGLFRCFCDGLPTAEEAPWDADEAAFGLLSETLDDLIGSGGEATRPRPAADIAAWSAVHGLAMLCLDGPLAQVSQDERRGLLAATSAMVLHGLLD